MQFHCIGCTREIHVLLCHTHPNSPRFACWNTDASHATSGRFRLSKSKTLSFCILHQASATVGEAKCLPFDWLTSSSQFGVSSFPVFLSFGADPAFLFLSQTRDDKRRRLGHTWAWNPTEAGLKLERVLALQCLDIKRDFVDLCCRPISPPFARRRAKAKKIPRISVFFGYWWKVQGLDTDSFKSFSTPRAVAHFAFHPAGFSNQEFLQFWRFRSFLDHFSFLVILLPWRLLLCHGFWGSEAFTPELTALFQQSLPCLFVSMHFHVRISLQSHDVPCIFVLLNSWFTYSLGLKTLRNSILRSLSLWLWPFCIHILFFVLNCTRSHTTENNSFFILLFDTSFCFIFNFSLSSSEWTLRICQDLLKQLLEEHTQIVSDLVQARNAELKRQDRIPLNWCPVSIFVRFFYKNLELGFWLLSLRRMSSFA